jgi:hypothetical protein
MNRRKFLVSGGIVSAGLFGTGNVATSLCKQHSSTKFGTNKSKIGGQTRGIYSAPAAVPV